MGVKLGQKWAVKDGNLLASNQVGSRFFNKEFDFSRASNGTYVDRDGLLKTAELYNLISYSEDFSQWGGTNVTIQEGQLGYDGQYNATKLIQTAVNGYHYITTTASSGFNTLSIYAKAGEYNSLSFYQANDVSVAALSTFNLSSGEWTLLNHTATATDIGNGWYRLSINTNETTTAYRFYVNQNTQVAESGDGVSGIYIQGAQLVEGTEPLDYQYTNGLQGLPRISFEDSVGHLLLEPQRSNLITHSNSYNSWTKDDVTLTSGQLGVYGTNNAWLIQGNTNSSRHNINKSVSSTGQHSFSLYAKAKELQYIQIASAQTTDEYANFDLSDGSVGNVGSRFLDAKATSVGNGWYRLSVYTNNGSNSFYISLIQSKTDGWLPTYSGANSTDGLYIQHAQLESGSYPTSVIETTTTQITRLADVCNNSGSAQDFNSEEGVLYAEVASLTDTDADRIITLSDGTVNNSIRIYYHSATNFLFFQKYIANTRVVNRGINYLNTTDYNKLAISYDNTNFKVFANGSLLSTDSAGAAFAKNTLTELAFDGGSNLNPFYGKVRNVQVFTEALSDAELISLTT